MAPLHRKRAVFRTLFVGCGCFVLGVLAEIETLGLFGLAAVVSAGILVVMHRS